jgi:hypothetical protein
VVDADGDALPDGLTDGRLEGAVERDGTTGAAGAAVALDWSAAAADGE